MNQETSAARKGDDDVCDRRNPRRDVERRWLEDVVFGYGLNVREREQSW